MRDPGSNPPYHLPSEKFENKLGAQFQKTGALMKKSSQINGRPFSWKDFSIVLNIDILKPFKSKKNWENLDSNDLNVQNATKAIQPLHLIALLSRLDRSKKAIF